jgi:hypothetical protein
MFRAIIYDKKNKSFWKYTRLYSEKKKCIELANSVVKKFKIKNPEVVITGGDFIYG